MKPLIYIVDNHEQDRNLLASLFQQHCPGCQIDSFSDGAQLLAALTQERTDLPNLILLNLGLPGMTGLDLLTRLKNNSPYRYIPVIMLTDDSQSAAITNSYQQGCNAFMIKPGQYADYSVFVERMTTYWLTISQLPNIMRN